VKHVAAIILCAACALAGCGAEPTRVLAPQESVQGRGITAWTEAWFKWTFAVPAARNPALVLGEDCGVGQTEPVFFVPAYDGAKAYQRTCRIAAGKPVLVPLWVLINDYPCPDSAFEPAPGQSMEAFLAQGAKDYNDLVADLRATLDGEPVDLRDHRHTTGLFDFTAEPSLVGTLPDACLQGTSQPGVSDGWWLMLSLEPGEHVVHVTGIDPSKDAIDYTYKLSVTR
jgi:hypothetical protein